LLEGALRPIVDAAPLGHDDLAVLVLTGDPIGVLRYQVRALRIKHINQAKPVAKAGLLLVEVQELLEIVAKAETDPLPPCGFIAFEYEAGEEPRRAMLDC